MSVRLGISPIAWSNDDLPSLGGETPLEDCLRDAAEVGYAGVELGTKFPRQPAALGAALEPYGLALVSGWWGARLLEREAEAELEAMAPHVRLLQALGSDVLVFAEVTGSVHGDRSTPLSRRPRLDATGFETLGRRLSRVAKVLAEEGLRLAYHHHVGTVVETADEIDALLAACDERVGLLLDTGHLTAAGADPAQVAQRYAERIAHVHLKDVRAEVLAEVRAQDRSFLDGVLAGLFTVPGDGAVDFAPVLAALAAADYRGWLVVEAEQDPRRAEPRRYAQLGFDAVTEWMRAAGWT